MSVETVFTSKFYEGDQLMTMNNFVYSRWVTSKYTTEVIYLTQLTEKADDLGTPPFRTSELGLTTGDVGASYDVSVRWASSRAT